MKSLLLAVIYCVLFTAHSNAVDTTEISPVQVLQVSWGDGEDEVYINNSGFGEIMYPAIYGVDREGNVYIDDTKGIVNDRIQVYDKYGNYIRAIRNVRKLHGISKIGFDANNNLVVSDNAKILSIDNSDECTTIISVSHASIEPYLWNFIVFDNEIVFKDNSGYYRKAEVEAGDENPYLSQERISTFSENVGLPRALTRDDIHGLFVTSNGYYISHDINKMRSMCNTIQMIKADSSMEKGQVEGNVPFQYDEPSIRFFGIDKDGNSYWYYLSRKQIYYSTIYVYDQTGDVLIKFDTIEKGDIKVYPYYPFVDYRGNIYVMQVWLDDGAKVFKYERQW